MTGGDNDRTKRSRDDNAALIFPLAAEPALHRKWVRKAAVAGLISALLAGAVVAVNQLNHDTRTGKLASVASGADKPLTQMSGVLLSVFELEPGTCLAELVDDTDVWDVPTVGCDNPHVAEVVAALRMPDGSWPGAAAVDGFAAERCVTAIHRAGVASSPNLSWTYFGPTEHSWNSRDDRTISCVVVSTGVPLTASVISDSGP